VLLEGEKCWRDFHLFSQASLLSKVKKIGDRGSDGNLRKHLGTRHKDLVRDVLFPSQKRPKTRPTSTPRMPPIRKRELDKAAVTCISLDMRGFNDFRKEGR
jgi:hypothetical protein